MIGNMHVMRRIFTYLLAAGLFAFCVFSEEIIPQNMSYGLLSTVKRNTLKDRKEIYDDMKAIVVNGLIKIELYDKEGTLLETVESTDDFDEELEFLFATEEVTIKTITNLQTLKLP